MCLSLPAKVLAIEGDMAEVSVGGAVFRAGLQMVEGVKPGDYVLLHAGFAQPPTEGQMIGAEYAAGDA